MREIKFRGYSKELNKWFIGALDNTLNWADFIIVHEHGFGIKNRIDSETVGQYTGLKDKNSVEIYEGDIILYQDCKGEVYYCNDTCMFMAKFKTTHSSWSFDSMDDEITVIGNIHENPELITQHKN